MVAVVIHATSPSADPTYNVHPHSADVWIEITQPSVTVGPLVTFDFGDGDSAFNALTYEPGTPFPNAVWKTATFSKNYAVGGLFTITAFGDGVSTGWYRDEFNQKQPLPTTTLTFFVVGVTPLRQYPRDDAFGGAPRQGVTNGPTSIQSSARQGWKNTYR